MKNVAVLLIIIFSLFLLACDDDDSTTTNNANNINNTSNVNNINNTNNTNNVNNVNNINNTNNQVDPRCEEILEGQNQSFMVGNTGRSFYIKIPTGTPPENGWAVVFAWHGTGDTAVNFKGLIEPQVNNNTMPFIAITPDNDPYYTMNALPPTGIDWDILNTNDGMADVDLYDSLMECVRQRWKVDEDHIHTMGFSAGSIMADLLSLIRNSEIASVFTYSGAYLNNSENINDLQPAGVSSFVQWPEFSTNNKYTQVIIHGADGDASCTGPDTCDKYTVPLGAYGTFVANFNHMGNFDSTFLPAAGHDVIHCDHNMGHTNGGPTIITMIQFFLDHPKGTVDSPYATTLPSGFSPDMCTFVPKQ
jgi:predicted esterase